MWLLLTVGTVVVLLLPLERSIVTLSKQELAAKLTAIRKKDAYGLYGILLADRSNTLARTLVDTPAYKEDLRDIAGKQCCFIYFVDPSDQAATRRTEYEQHAELAHKLAQWLELDIRQYPCLLFFERLENQAFIALPLDGKSPDDVIKEARALFAFVREQEHQAHRSAFEAITQYQHALRIKVVGKRALAELKNVLTDVAAKVTLELFTKIV